MYIPCDRMCSYDHMLILRGKWISSTRLDSIRQYVGATVLHTLLFQRTVPNGTVLAF